MSAHNQDAIDLEALRIANVGRPFHQMTRFLDTLNPLAQQRYRMLAEQNLRKGSSMSPFHLSIADNVGFIRAWHDKTHSGPWSACVWEPCDQTETEFRKVWSKP